MYILAFISLINVLFVLYLYIIGRIKHGEEINKLDKKDYPLKFIMYIGYYILTALKYQFNNSYDVKMLSRFNEIYGRKLVKEKYKFFLVEKISLCLFILFLFSLISVITLINSFGSMESIQTQTLYRDENVDKMAKVLMRIDKDDQFIEEEVLVKIPKKDETLEEIKTKVHSAATEIDKYFSSIEVVDTPLNFIEQYKGIEIDWSSSNTNILDNKGNIHNENIDPKGSEIVLTAKLTYKDYSEKVDIKVLVKPMVVNKSISEIADEIKENINDGVYTEPNSLKLPTKLDEPEDIKITWKQIYETDAMSTFIFGLITSIIIFFMIDENIKRKQQKKKMMIRLLFPDMIAKFTLLINAGMTTYSAWQKICEDYLSGLKDGRGENPLYEEMLLTLSDMKGGISEYLAYEFFGSRVSVNEIKKFTNVLSQSIKRGNADLIISLRQLSTDAWETRISAAKRLGEEAATKLLFPMMILLFVIIAIVITPAFMTMG